MVIDRQVPTTWGYFGSARPMWPMEPQVAKIGSKHQNLNGMRWVAKLLPPKDWPKVAARLIFSQLVAILATFFEIWPLNLLCLLLL